MGHGSVSGLMDGCVGGGGRMELGWRRCVGGVGWVGNLKLLHLFKTFLTLDFLAYRSATLLHLYMINGIVGCFWVMFHTIETTIRGCPKTT